MSPVGLLVGVSSRQLFLSFECFFSARSSTGQLRGKGRNFSDKTIAVPVTTHQLPQKGQQQNTFSMLLCWSKGVRHWRGSAVTWPQGKPLPIVSVEQKVCLCYGRIASLYDITSLHGLNSSWLCHLCCPHDNPTASFSGLAVTFLYLLSGQKD